MNNIFLRNNNGFLWFCTKKTCVKGYFFDKENEYFEKEKLCSFFEDVKSEQNFIKKIKEINGIFSVIVTVGNQIFIASDTTRMFPFFYTFNGQDLLISDDIEFILNKFKDPKIDEQSAIEFNSTGYTIGKHTLLKNIFQIQSNEYIIFNKNKIKTQAFFFSYATETVNNAPYEEQKKQGIEIFNKSFRRLIKSLKNKHIALPLSGGYDSRLIAVMLKKHGFENVTCYTYGRKNNKELENSRKVAKTLNYKWVFIEYNKELIENYIDTDVFKKYIEFVGKFSSMPLLQEYFAVKYLKKNKIIPDNSIFIPGHSGDFIGGSQLVKVVNHNVKVENVPNLIFKSKFFYNSISGNVKKVTKKTIKNNLLNFNLDYKNKLAYTVFEDADIKEKIAKFIFNSSSVYNYFGYEHRFPFWDKELITFFKTVPFKYKVQKLLYDDILKNTYFEQLNVNFKTEIQPNKIDILKQKFKNKIKPFLPYFVKKRLLYKKDWIFYKEITDQMTMQLKAKNIKYNKKINSYNSIIIQWYMNIVRESIN